MVVPDGVRAEALAAYDARRPGVHVLALLDDSCTGVRHRLHLPDPPGVRRVLVFAGDEVRVTVRELVKAAPGPRPDGSTRLTLIWTPALPFAVQVLTPRRELGLRWDGREDLTNRGLEVVVPARGPLSFELTEGASRWQTAWITL